MCVFSLNSPALKAHAPYYIAIYGLSGSTKFFHIISKRHEFLKKVIGHKLCVFILSTTFICDIFHSKKKWARYDQKCILVFMYSTRYSCQILRKLEFYGQIFVKFLNIKFHENLFNGGRDVPCGRTDMTKWALFAILRKAPKNSFQLIAVTFFKFVFSFRGGHQDYSSRGSKNNPRYSIATVNTLNVSPESSQGAEFLDEEHVSLRTDSMWMHNKHLYVQAFYLNHNLHGQVFPRSTLTPSTAQATNCPGIKTQANKTKHGRRCKQRV